MRLRLPAGFEPLPPRLGDLDADLRNPRLPLDDFRREGKCERFDLVSAMTTCRGLDDVLDRLARQQPIALPLDECRDKLPLEPERHRQVTRIVTVAAADDTEQPQPGFTVTARGDFRRQRRQIVPFTGSSPAADSRRLNSATSVFTTASRRANSVSRRPESAVKTARACAVGR